MIISILDYNITGVELVVDIVEYKEHMKGHIHFYEQLFPMSTISLTFFYVGF